ncbi:FliA/WhiG family RNA polymerase sigma factor [Shewanella sp. A32]|uniref:FliA/WhiG family RNA polymerase sigma factor n=1 Tax=Shewanella sp. A32 TaxID=3031327 RepID=UPI0023B989FC|nr:FliA/WhiG family RNA polymerase sigma factor [Shewanella sp. A32]MDF0535725.1 FliA/WhiG family RNA polymerase sigma factor [Shewanella sp. A32]
MSALCDWQNAGDSLDSAPVQREAEVLQHYAYLVRRVVAHMRSQIGVVADRDDLQQIGLMALLKAIRRYGKERDEQFESYAFKYIRGAMLDEFRRLDWRSRQARQDAHRFRDGVRKLRNQLGREPKEREICAALNISTKELMDFHYLEQAEVVDSFEQLLEQQGPMAADDRDIHRLELRRLLAQSMQHLPARNKLLLQLYYTHELNMKEIALTLGLTESRVCQLHRQSLQLLTEKLTS